MKLSLLVTTGVARGTVIPITKPQFLIGRSRQCQLRPSSSVVSDYHCSLLARNGKVFLRDLNTKAGTLINDRRLHGELELADTDVFTVGPLTFQVRIDSEPAVVEPTIQAAPAATEPESTPPEEVADTVVDDVVLTLPPRDLPPIPVQQGFARDQPSEEDAAVLLLEPEKQAEPAPIAAEESATTNLPVQEVPVPWRPAQVSPARSSGDAGAAAKAILREYRSARVRPR